MNILNSLPDKLRSSVDGFCKDVQNVFGEKLRSVILYGSMARREMTGSSFIRFLVVVDDTTPSEIAPCSKFVGRWLKHRIALPLFLKPGYIARSLDTFPLEFMDMASCYQVLYGEDALAQVTVRKTDVRKQCERELKGKLLHLRAEYLTHRGNIKALTYLIGRSLNSFRAIFSGALFLKDIKVPVSTEEVLTAISTEFNLDTSLLLRLYKLTRGEGKIDKQETDTLFDKYVEELDKLSQTLDTLTVTEE